MKGRAQETTKSPGPIARVVMTLVLLGGMGAAGAVAVFAWHQVMGKHFGVTFEHGASDTLHN